MYKVYLQAPVPELRMDTRQLTASKVNNSKARHSILSDFVIWRMPLWEDAYSSRPRHARTQRNASWAPL